MSDEFSYPSPNFDGFDDLWILFQFKMPDEISQGIVTIRKSVWYISSVCVAAIAFVFVFNGCAVNKVM